MNGRQCHMDRWRHPLVPIGFGVIITSEPVNNVASSSRKRISVAMYRRSVTYIPTESIDAISSIATTPMVDMYIEMGTCVVQIIPDYRIDDKISTP